MSPTNDEPATADPPPGEYMLKDKSFRRENDSRSTVIIVKRVSFGAGCLTSIFSHTHCYYYY